MRPPSINIIGEMNRRQEQLLQIVLKNPGTSIRDLATQLGVSERTIRNDIRDVPGLFGGRQGVRADEAAWQVLTSKSAIPQDQEDRILWLVRQVLLEGQTPEFEDACGQLAVSASTLKADIMLFNRRMEGTGCRLRLRQKHIVCTGDEEQVRDALRRITRSSAPDAFVHPAFLKTVFDPDLVDAVQRACDDWLAKNRNSPNDLLQLTLIQHCTLIAARNPLGPPVHEGLAGALEQATGRQLSPADGTACSQLEALAKGTGQIQPEILAFASGMVSHLESRYAIQLDRDSFLPLFCSHLQQLRTRICQGREQVNPLKDSIRQQSPFVFDMAANAAGLFEERFACHLSEDEIAFFALHIGSSLGLQATGLMVQVVCPAYHGLRDSFLHGLQAAFPDHIRFQAVQRDDIDPDLPVISAVPLARAHLQVAPFPGPEDLIRIRRYLEDWQRRKAAADIDKLFSASRFLVHDAQDDLPDQEGVIRFLSARMVQDGLADPTLADRVLARERIAGTAFGGFAIPHALHEATDQSGIAVALFPDGLDWKDTRVRAVFLLQLSIGQNGLFGRFYNRFIRLLQRPEVLDSLLQARDHETFRQKLLGFWTEE